MTRAEGTGQRRISMKIAALGLTEACSIVIGGKINAFPTTPPALTWGSITRRKASHSGQPGIPHFDGNAVGCPEWTMRQKARN